MSGILQAIEASAINTIEAGGMKWRCRKITSAHLARVGHAALAVAQGMGGPNNSENAAEDYSEDVLKQVAAASEKQLETMAKLKDAVVAAGLIAVGDPVTDEWVDTKVCLEPNQANARKGVIWVGSLPQEVSDAIFAEVMSLSTDGGRSIERLKSFRERTRNHSGAGSDSPTLWENTGRGA